MTPETRSEEELSITELMKDSLKAEGSSEHVNIFSKCYLYMPEDFLHSCIDELQHKAQLAEAGIEEMTDVDRLAFHVLFTAAGIEKEVEERFAKAKQSQTTTGEQK